MNPTDHAEGRDAARMGQPVQLHGAMRHQAITSSRRPPAAILARLAGIDCRGSRPVVGWVACARPGEPPNGWYLAARRSGEPCFYLGRDGDLEATLATVLDGIQAKAWPTEEDLFDLEDTARRW